ncbi:hypothetical protein V1387_14850 [Allomuricauda taeanensis]|uniref:hypothetical protein n=1 Tax=Flagellimonas taeanensis TaxID=1005926 RepID=UPI002E7BB813|nr:hypothetical protein [Allomuricauda taeanensis]MEE1963970.1 hypothetical protein [Allomuricauda taeanensis]
MQSRKTAHNKVLAKAGLSANNGDSIPPSPNRIEHPPTGHNNVNFKSLLPNIGWLKFSDFGVLNHPTHPHKTS